MAIDFSQHEAINIRIHVVILRDIFLILLVLLFLTSIPLSYSLWNPYHRYIKHLAFLQAYYHNQRKSQFTHHKANREMGTEYTFN